MVRGTSVAYGKSMQHKSLQPKEVIPTVVPSSLEEVVQARNAYAPFASALHIDAADGRFAPNTTWMPHSGEKLPEGTFYEAHLMVENPLAVGVMFARAGAARIIGHVEAFANAESACETFDMWRGAGAKHVGLGILFATPLQELAPYISLCDCVTVMTIARIGVQGIPYEERAVERIKTLHERYPKLTISVDGGVSKRNVAELAHAGAARFSVGSAIAKSADPQKVYDDILAASRV